MASFLFLLVAEDLAGLFKQANKKNLYCGIKVGSNDTNVGLLEFADNTIFMCDAKV